MSEPGGFRRLLDRAALAAVPVEVTLELTHRCSLACQHCYIPDRTAPDGVPTERLLALLEELASLGTLWLTLTGGEPLLRRDWATIALRARELGFKVVLLTNGLGVDDRVAARLSDLAVKVEVSVHALDPAVFDATTRVPGSCERVIAAVERLASHRVHLMLKLPLTGLNVGVADDVFAWAERLGVECRAYDTIVAGKDGSCAPIALRAPLGLLAAHHRAREARRLDPARAPGDIPCAAGVRLANISANGDVLACNTLPIVAGNVRSTPFAEIWHSSPLFLRLRSLRMRDIRECAQCSRVSYCGRCYARALTEDGDMLGPCRSACAYAAMLESVEAERA